MDRQEDEIDSDWLAPFTCEDGPFESPSPSLKRSPKAVTPESMIAQQSAAFAAALEQQQQTAGLAQAASNEKAASDAPTQPAKIHPFFSQEACRTPPPVQRLPRFKMSQMSQKNQYKAKGSGKALGKGAKSADIRDVIKGISLKSEAPCASRLPSSSSASPGDES